MTYLYSIVTIRFMTNTVFLSGLDVLQLLKQLVVAQDQLIDVLQRTQPLLVRPDKEALAAIIADEEQVITQWQSILKKREELLTAARMQNIDGNSIEALCHFYFPNNYEVHKILTEAKEKRQQIHFIAFTNWTLSRKSLVHISQVLKLIETNGQGKTTYSVFPSGNQGGGFVDRVA
ncbi:hypothetical protein FACS1894170_00240 [Planctomycetales bacterium]|nr:hypothetical protein FACS1894170_00240 [Planctomycetales bacterium]